MKIIELMMETFVEQLFENDRLYRKMDCTQVIACIV